MKPVAGLIIASFLWYLMFAVRPLNFWTMMSASSVLLMLISYKWGRPLVQMSELTVKNIIIGTGSAALLYFIFWLGNIMLPYLVKDYAGSLNSIYANKDSLSPAVIGALLIFPIGSGEEVFWRGFIQKQFSLSYGKWIAFFLTTAAYAAVHIPSMNPVLILAALTCGTFWGFIYLLTGSIVPVVISHMLWDPLIFVIMPIN